MQKKREFGRAFYLKKIFTLDQKLLKSTNSVWMSHEDAVVKLPKDLKLLHTRKIQNLQLLKIQKKLYGVQFHPEVTHTVNGKQIFKNFLFLICKIKKMECYISKSRLIGKLKYCQK